MTCKYGHDLGEESTILKLQETLGTRKARKGMKSSKVMEAKQ